MIYSPFKTYKMKNLLVFLVAIFCSEVLATSNQFSTEPRLFVSAVSGLTLRTNPSTTSSAINVIPYGAKVSIIEDTLCYEEIEVGWVSGSWTLVEFEKEIGYVFNGFLSPFSLPAVNEDFISDFNLTSIAKDWAFHTFSVDQCADTISNDFITEINQTFVSGEALKIFNTEKRTITEITLKNIRIMDAFHLTRSMIIGKENQGLFDESAIYIKNRFDELSEIRFKYPFQISIKKINDSEIKIKIEEEKVRT
jgi:uncharacterized protein YraI